MQSGPSAASRRSQLTRTNTEPSILYFPDTAGRAGPLSTSLRDESKKMFQPTIYPIQTLGGGSLSVMAKPVSGEWIDDEFAGIARLGISHIVSLLEYQEAIEVGLQNELQLAEQHDMLFTSFPVADRCLPASVEAFADFTRTLYHGILEGSHTVVHCRAGIGRAGMTAAGILLHHGLTTPQAFELISKQRRVPVPDTPEQYHWILKHEKQITGKVELS